MKVQQFRPFGLVALTYSMVLLLSAGPTATTAQYVCIDSYLGDGDCDANNNNEDCGESCSVLSMPAVERLSLQMWAGK